MGSQGDGFADDDPLAELARIVGFDQPQRREPPREPSLDVASGSAEFNLEDELMGEFDGYVEPVARSYSEDTFVAASEPVVRHADAPAWQADVRREEPRFASEAQAAPEPLFDAAPAEAYFAPEPHQMVAAPAFDVEPTGYAAPDASYSVRRDAYDAPQVEAQPTHYRSHAELAPVAHASQRSDFSAAAPDYGHSDPYGFDADFEPSSYAVSPANEPSQPIDLADELEMAVSEPFAPVAAPQAEPPRLRLPLANFQVAARRVEPPLATPPAAQPPAAPSSALPLSVDAPLVQPVVSQVDVKVDPLAFDWSQVAAGPVEPVPRIAPERPVQASIEPPMALAAPSRNEIPVENDPVFSFDFAQQLAEAEEFDQRPVATIAPSRAEPLVAAPSATFASLDVDPFVDQEFELQLDELDIDLSDIEPVAARPVQPMLAAPQILSAPALEAPRTVHPSDTRTSSIAPTLATATMQASARLDPDFTAMRVQPVQPTVPQPVQASFAPVASVSVSPRGLNLEQDIGFDPAEIAEQDDMLETIAPMDVPEVPVAESQPQVAATSDFDLDLDAELATLLDEPVAAPPQQPVALGVTSPVQAADAGRTAGPLDEFEAFEKALEEDFRTAMTPATPVERPNRGHIQIAGHGQGSYRKIKPYLMAGTAAVLLLAGAGGIYAWLGSGAVGSLGGGEPVVIAADKTPTKIVPEDPGGKTVPNQDKAVYDRVAGNGSDDPTQPNLISSEEQPMDVVQRTLIPENLPMEGENDFLGTPVGETEDPRLLPEGQQAQTAAAEDPATITPRRVRTMIVRPDGTLVAQEVPAEPEASPLQAATKTGVLAAPSVANENTGNDINTVAARSVTPTAETPAPSETAQASPAASAAAQLAAATEAQAQAQAQAQTETAAATPTASSAIPTSRPAEQPVNIVGTVTDQGNLRPAQPVTAQDTVPTQTAAVSASPAETGAAGSYGIQIASLPSQADAERSYRNLTSRFGNILGGKPHEIREAAIPGKGTYYRVRILASSRDAAVALCEQYRSAGGSCLVSR
ncbi:hypothetical protein IP76_19910 [Rhizobium sp. AAP43]|nr:hypothetical protein IP76_19910 [Rhizobium sp. AAP43]